MSESIDAEDLPVTVVAAHSLPLLHSNSQMMNLKP